GRELHGLAVILAVARPLAGNHRVDAVVAEDALQLHHVGKPRHVVEHERLVGQQARDHQRQGGVLRPRNPNGARGLPAADDPDAVHVVPRLATLATLATLAMLAVPVATTQTLGDCGESRGLILSVQRSLGRSSGWRSGGPFCAGVSGSCAPARPRAWA